MTIKEALQKAISLLQHKVELARFEAEALLSHQLQKNRVYLLTHEHATLTKAQVTQYLNQVAERAKGKPFAYLTGSKAFHDLMLTVNEAVLIPRPDTELLVETALLYLTKKQSSQLLDLGTGSGAIALAIAKARPQCQVVATDISPKALATAKHNAQSQAIANVSFYEGSWFAALPKSQRFDIIASNPPYIASDDPHLQGEIRFEPQQALVSAKAGLADLEQIIQQAYTFLKPNGLLLVEHGYQQGESVRSLFALYGYQLIQTLHDLSGNERVTLGKHNIPGENNPTL